MKSHSTKSEKDAHICTRKRRWENSGTANQMQGVIINGYKSYSIITKKYSIITEKSRSATTTPVTV
jgi:hypothetical protein